MGHWKRNCQRHTQGLTSNRFYSALICNLSYPLRSVLRGVSCDCFCGSLMIFYFEFAFWLNSALFAFEPILHSRIVFQNCSAAGISLNFLNIHNEMIKGAASLGGTVLLGDLLSHPLWRSLTELYRWGAMCLPVSFMEAIFFISLPTSHSVLFLLALLFSLCFMKIHLSVTFKGSVWEVSGAVAGCVHQ